jgi:exodeoxyribonuclease VII small subunit
MNRLEEIVNLLDDGNLPVEEMLKIYEEGMTIASEMRNFLEKAEQKVIDISAKNKKSFDSSTDEN